ncbi:MAG: hypothetical protein L6R38_002398 [Xanthoria sp. 2 TBL-2021]|nr:MAG: hypothetical protein L6R38_002398 [Xanthoria sp. 2 TBL-2021]
MAPLAADSSVPNGFFPFPPPANMPLAAPPPRVTPNFDHPASNAWHVDVTAAVCIPLIVLFSSLRLYTQYRLYPSRTIADYTFMLAAAWTIIYIGILLALLDKGLFGRHIWDLKMEDLTNAPFLMVLILEAIYGPFVWIIKVSLFCLYRQIFAPKQYLLYLVWAGIIVTGVFYWSTLVAAVALCAPRGNETYIMAFATARCGETKGLAVVSGVFNVLSDLYLLVIPIPATLALHLPRRKKIALLFLFATGVLAFNASCLGLHYRIQVNRSLDDTWKIMPLYLAIIIEMTAGIAVLCMPAMAALSRRYTPAVTAYFSRNNDDSNDNEHSTFYEMAKPRNVANSSNARKVEAQSSNNYGHTATSSSESANELRPNTSDSVTLAEKLGRASGSPKM